MKILYSLCLSLPLLASLQLTSCVATVETPGVTSVGVGYYTELPATYDQPYYLYNNRYYYGGSWQPGRYYYGGRYHEGRYSHQGHYFYGGRYETSRHGERHVERHVDRHHHNDHDRDDRR